MTDPIITVRGEAQLEVPPELATLWITLDASGPEGRAVWQTLSGQSEQLGSLLDRYEAAVEERATTGARVHPVFKARKPGKITGYRGQQQTRVVVHDFEALSPLLLGVADLPGCHADGPHWSLRPGHEAYRQARIAAIDDARTRAADYAAGFDGRVGAVLEISDLEGGGGMQPRFAMAAAGYSAVADDDLELQLEPQSQTVSGQITVRFALELGGS